MPVDIVALDYDFWFAAGEADDALDDGEISQAMGPDGVLYYYRFARAGDEHDPTWVDSAGHATIEQAAASAQERTPTPIVWQ